MKRPKDEIKYAIEVAETRNGGLHLINNSGVTVANLRVFKDRCICDVTLFIDGEKERHNDVEYTEAQIEDVWAKMNLPKQKEKKAHV